MQDFFYPSLRVVGVMVPLFPKKLFSTNLTYKLLNKRNKQNTRQNTQTYSNNNTIKFSLTWSRMSGLLLAMASTVIFLSFPPSRPSWGWSSRVSGLHPVAFASLGDMLKFFLWRGLPYIISPLQIPTKTAYCHALTNCIEMCWSPQGLPQDRGSPYSLIYS